ncbi:hypothetical protein RUM44_000149 [Polyplax serrata]|uniref:Uncharacterized protein n=1 Tax=Polyplax serrata TaxID=468196 RepID=A0ABR1B536_POLSC
MSNDLTRRWRPERFFVCPHEKQRKDFRTNGEIGAGESTELTPEPHVDHHRNQQGISETDRTSSVVRQNERKGLTFREKIKMLRTNVRSDQVQRTWE